MSNPLPLKHRPKDLKDIIGNSSLKKKIKSILNKDIDSMPTTFLLSGPSGCGKTTIARIMTKDIGASDTDIKQLNISDTRGIDTGRAIVDMSKHAPWGKIRVFILNECQKATKEFWNSLLEILEEPPQKTMFILCTTEPQVLPKAVRTRCTDLEVSLLGIKFIELLITKTLKKEKKKLNKNIIEKITKLSEGSPRQALVILDSVIDMDSEKSILKELKNYKSEEKLAIDLCRALMKKKWPVVVDVLKKIKQDPETVRYTVLKYMAKTLLNSREPIIPANIIESFENTFIYTKNAGLYKACYECCADENGDVIPF